MRGRHCTHHSLSSVSFGSHDSSPLAKLIQSHQLVERCCLPSTSNHKHCVPEMHTCEALARQCIDLCSMCSHPAHLCTSNRGPPKSGRRCPDAVMFPLLLRCCSGMSSERSKKEYCHFCSRVQVELHMAGFLLLVDSADSLFHRFKELNDLAMHQKFPTQVIMSRLRDSCFCPASSRDPAWLPLHFWPLLFLP